MKKIRRLFLDLLLLFGVILISACGEIEAGNYYISNNGNDNANGHTPSTAWKTISKVNSRKFAPGDSILFKAGGVWRETLVVSGSGTPGNPIVYSLYGTGDNPKIFGSEKAENWTLVNGSVYSAATSLTNPRDYYPGNIFILADDSVTWGNFKEFQSGLSTLQNEYDWTWNDNKVFIYSVKDPNIAYDQVEVNQRARCAMMPDNNPSSYIVFDGIDMHFGQQAGFDAGYPAYRGATDLVFRNCNIGYIGERASGYAYGIAAWHSDFLVENCVITDCGRRGISINLYLERPKHQQRNLNNIIIRNNTFKRGFHTTSLDLSSQQTSSDTMTNIYFYCNLVDDSEHTDIQSSWTSNQLFTQSGESYINNVFIFNNIFVHATGRNILIEGGDSIFVWNNTIMGHNPNITSNPYANVSFNSPLKVDFRNNILFDNLPDNSLQNHGVLMYYKESSYIAKDYNLYYSLHPGAERNINAGYNDNGSMGYTNTNKLSWEAYKFYNKRFEQHSPVPQNPIFVNITENLSLSEGSPARGAGVQIEIIKSDYYGHPMNDPPDLGAIQFGSTPTTK